MLAVASAAAASSGALTLLSGLLLDAFVDCARLSRGSDVTGSLPALRALLLQQAQLAPGGQAGATGAPGSGAELQGSSGTGSEGGGLLYGQPGSVLQVLHFMQRAQ